MSTMGVYEGNHTIVLDPQIRNWVLLPIMAVMVLIGVLRHYVTSILNSSSGPKAIDFREQRQSNAIMRSALLRRNHKHIPPGSITPRQQYYLQAFKEHKYLKSPPVEDKDGPPALFGQPPDQAGMDAMMSGMKNNLMMIVPQTVIMGLINSFFSGFLLIKLPFPLTLRFKAMLQRDIQTPYMDAAWVSALSWYFLNLFGLSSIYTLILGNNNAAGSAADMAAMNPMAASASTQAAPGEGVPMPTMPGPGLPGQQQNVVKMFEGECEYLELLSSGRGKWIGDGIEARVLNKYKALVR
ncbi:hypothetical protein RI367_002410 [Sorochytrium milnesiophthora]